MLLPKAFQPWVEIKPHQVDAALFALHSSLSKGVTLADEVGLGKTIEASLVIAQSWAERRRRILLVASASLRKQWQQELREKFSLPSRIMEARTWNEARKAGQPRPVDAAQEIILTSYEFAARRADDLQQSLIKCELCLSYCASGRPSLRAATIIAPHYSYGQY